MTWLLEHPARPATECTGEREEEYQCNGIHCLLACLPTNLSLVVP